MKLSLMPPSPMASSACFPTTAISIPLHSPSIVLFVFPIISFVRFTMQDCASHGYYRDNVEQFEDTAVEKNSTGFVLWQMRFSSVLAREDIASLLIPETQFNGHSRKMSCQLMVTPESVAKKISTVKENNSHKTNRWNATQNTNITCGEISVMLAHAFNMSLTEGTYLEWNEANIIPLL